MADFPFGTMERKPSNYVFCNIFEVFKYKAYDLIDNTFPFLMEKEV